MKHLSRRLVLAAFAIAGIVLVVAPILALSWSARPFPGFVVEQTLLVSDYHGNSWDTSLLTQGSLQRLAQIGDQIVDTPAQLTAALSTRSIGHESVVRTVLADGTMRLYSFPTLERFPRSDLLRLFWLPYGVSAAYLALGAWVYGIRGETRPGRAFALFCIVTSIVTGLLFDLITTHVGSELWTIGMALLGGVLIRLALLFPQEASLVRRRPWVGVLPYVPSAVIAGWGVRVLRDQSAAWAYVDAWRTGYVYAALAILVFIGTMLYRQLTASSAIARQQARVILLGSVVAFSPLGVWLGTPLFGVELSFQTGLFVPFLLVFPLSIAVAIARYRLWDVDLIVNRALVYTALTAILAAIYYGSVLGLEALLQTTTGQTSPLAVALSTLGIAVLFNPLRQGVQSFVDRRFYREKYDAAKTLGAFGQALRDEVDLPRLVHSLEAVTEETLQPTMVCSWLRTPTGFARIVPRDTQNLETVFEVTASDPLVAHLRAAPGVVQLDKLDSGGPALEKMRRAGAELIVPFISQRELIGWLALGPRLSEQAYTTDDRTLLRSFAAQVGPALRVAQLVEEREAEALERARLDYELRFARSIQQALLPKETPELRGWQIDVYWQPARAVGGDFYDFLALPDGRLSLVIADVADKGIPASIVMATTRSILRGTARRMLSPGEALAQANDILVPELPQGMFVTCLYALLDPATGRLQYANAGHNWPYRQVDGRVAELRATGMALGLIAGMRYDEYETTVLPGESLLLYSDGLTEAHSPSGEMLGSHRLQALLEAHTGSSEPVIGYLLRELTAFTGADWAQEDDVTLLSVRRSKDQAMVDTPRRQAHAA
jgi:serine phosphatase RsbU (regulator of sigma subunit)